MVIRGWRLGASAFANHSPSFGNAIAYSDERLLRRLAPTTASQCQGSFRLKYLACPQCRADCRQQRRSKTISIRNATMNLKWAIFVSILDSAAGTTTCHDPTGNVQSNLVPCDPTAAVSMCCLAADYLLSFQYSLLQRLRD